MENINQWTKHSFIIKILSLLLSLEVFKNSISYKVGSLVSNTFSAWFKNSFFRFFTIDGCWEIKALKKNFFKNILLKGEKLLKNIAIFTNRIIKNSIYYRINLELENQFFHHPLRLAAILGFPMVLTSTLLKISISGLSKKGLVIRLFLLAITFIMRFSHTTLKGAFKGSLSISIFNLLFCNRSNNVTTLIPENKNYKLSCEGKITLLLSSILLGFLQFYLPRNTFLKTVVVLFLPMLIYRRPELGMISVVFILPLTPTAYSISLILLTFISLLLGAGKYKMRFSTGVVPASFFALLAISSSIFSIMRTDSLKSLPLYLAYIMIFFLAANLFKHKKVLVASMISYTLSATVVSLYGLYQYFFKKITTAIAWVDVQKFPELSTRIFSTLENPNVLGEYLMLAIPVIFALLWMTKNFKNKLLLIGVLGVLNLCLVLTFSRGAWLGLALSILLFASLKDSRLFLLIIVIVMISPFFMPEVVIDRIESIGSLEDSSNTFRISIWIAALRMMKDYWATGLGLGLPAFARVYRDYMIAGTPAVHAHNLYLQLGLEMGILGLLTLGLLIVTGFSKARLVLKTSTKPDTYLLAAALSAIAGHLLHGLFDYVWYSPKIVMVFWMTFGMLSALSSSSGSDEVIKEELL